MQHIFVRPRDGLVLRMPEGFGTLPAEGMEVEDSLYWRRRIADGDVLLGPAPASKPKKEA